MDHTGRSKELIEKNVTVGIYTVMFLIHSDRPWSNSLCYIIKSKLRSACFWKIIIDIIKPRCVQPLACDLFILFYLQFC